MLRRNSISQLCLVRSSFYSHQLGLLWENRAKRRIKSRSYFQLKFMRSLQQVYRTLHFSHTSSECIYPCGSEEWNNREKNNSHSLLADAEREDTSSNLFWHALPSLFTEVVLQYEIIYFGWDICILAFMTALEFCTKNSLHLKRIHIFKCACIHLFYII